MTKYLISINPFAEYLEATDSRKLKILEEQQVPDKKRLPYYQLAKGRMKKSIELSGSHKPINTGIKKLMESTPDKEWKKNNIKNSIVALENFKKMLLPDSIKENKIEIIKPKQKHFNYNGISIMVSPNIVFRITINGVKYIGIFSSFIKCFKISYSGRNDLV